MDVTNNKNILCSDCGINYITKERFANFGICLSCQRRKTIAKTHGNDYIKFIDLPKSEKDRLAKQRNQNNSWNRRKNIKTKTLNESMLTYVIDKFLVKYNYDSLNSLIVRLEDMYSKYKNYCNTEHYEIVNLSLFEKTVLASTCGFKKFIFHGEVVIYKGMTEDVIESKLINLKNIKSTDTRVVNKRNKNQIYTQDIIQEILSEAKDTMTVADLRQIFVDRYPDKNITVSNFNNIIARHKVPHLKYSGNRKIKNELVEKNTNVESKDDVLQSDDYGVNNITSVPSTQINSNQEVAVVDSNIVVLDADGDPIRLQPIKQEVVTVLDEKFKENKCNNLYNYSITDYINMLEMINYLSINIDDLIQRRDAQFTVANNYQFDIIHEMENELAEEGNTYLQDKMYIMRDYRRYMEVDYSALKQMRRLLKEIHEAMGPENKLGKCIGQLKRIVNENAQPKYIPRVDVGMTKKYDWAVNKNSNYKKLVNNTSTAITSDEANNINTETSQTNLGQELNNMENQLKSGEPIKSNMKIHDPSIQINKSLKNLKSNVTLTNSQIKAGFNVYRVSCTISGGGYGAYRPWFKDYACVKQEIAEAFGNQELARLRAENKSIMTSDIKCHKLNVI